MVNTYFDSPHGLCNILNISTAHDMAILTHKCMAIPLLAKIVKTLTYELKTEKRLYEWQNTNKLLGFDFDEDESAVKVFKGTLGCKTGIT